MATVSCFWWTYLLLVLCGHVCIAVVPLRWDTDDKVQAYSVHNKLQCQRLCWYQLHCGSFSYNTVGDEENCVLHSSPIQVADPRAGWISMNATDEKINNACASRPCGLTEVCVPSPSEHKCLPLCWNGGTLTAAGTCTCNNGYFGDMCENGPCIETEAPTINNSRVTSWRRLETALERDVICIDDHMYSTEVNGNTPVLRCLATGQWVLPAVECRQRIWRNEAIVENQFYPIPRRPSVGWTICIKGVASSRFSWLVHDIDTDNIAFTIAMTLPGYLAFDGRRGSSTWFQNKQEHKNLDPYPFTMNQPFEAKIIVTGTNTIQLHVDPNFVLSYTSKFNILDADDVFPRFSLDYELLDLWCNQ